MGSETLYRVRTLRRFRLDGVVVPLGMYLQTDSLRLVASMVQQGDARAIDAFTAADVALFVLLRRAIPAGEDPAGERRPGI